MQATIESNKQEMEANKRDSDEKIMNLIEDFKSILESTITSIMDQINMSKHSPDQNDSSTLLYPTTVVPANRRDPSLDGGNSTRIVGMCTIKHDISSPKFYDILIKTELKWGTTLDLNNFYNYIKMCLNTVTRLREDLLPD